MGDRDRHERHRSAELNRGDYRGDFGPEGYRRFEPRDDTRHHHSYRDEGPHGSDRRHEQTPADWRWRRTGREGWQRGRGYGSGYDAYAAGEGFRPAGFEFGPEEGPGPGGIADEEWQVTRPGRGRGRWAADWEHGDDVREREWRSGRQDYRGRGPKGYRRSDDRIREDVCERLTDDWSVDASDISVSVQDGDVTLAGFVQSRDQKHRAEEVIERIGGVREVINQLRISREGPMREEIRRADIH